MTVRGQTKLAVAWKKWFWTFRVAKSAFVANSAYEQHTNPWEVWWQLSWNRVNYIYQKNHVQSVPNFLLRSFIFRVLQMPLPETTLETLVRYLWTHLWVPFGPVAPTRFHRAFGRGVLWASSDSSWVCWAWLSYYITLYIFSAFGCFLWAKDMETDMMKILSLLWFWYLYPQQVFGLDGFATKPMARSECNIVETAQLRKAPTGLHQFRVSIHGSHLTLKEEISSCREKWTFEQFNVKR